MAVPLEQVLITDELLTRPSRPRDDESENRALSDLEDLMTRTGDIGGVLQALAEKALELCGAHSAGISILEELDGGEVFRWRAAAGSWSPYRGDVMPRTSPCGTVVDGNMSMLMTYPERHYAYAEGIGLPIAEALLVPLNADGRAIGTIWVLSHDEKRRFDAEDRRILTSLGRFAADAYRRLG